jgi:two-component system chemotaxis response regulator CheY
MSAQPVPLESPTHSQTDALRVLVVDDASGMRAYLRTILSSAGFDCVEAPDGAAGFEAVLGGGIDLVITDLDMPEMDGFGLICAISLLPVTQARPPVIVASGLLDETLAERRPELRAAAALLAKPVKPAELLKAVSRAIATRAAGS